MTESATAGMITPAGEAAATVNGIGYTDLMDALDAAEELGGATVIVLNDQSLTKHIVVSEGTTLDLNGHSVVTTKTFTVYGDVIDGTVGGYGYISGSRVLVDGEESFLAIYDTAVGGYRFYAYELLNMGGKASGTNAVKFGFRLVLANIDGYTVLANTTDAKLTLTAHVSWTSFSGELKHTFATATIKDFAAQSAAQLATGAALTKVITLTVSGLSSLPEGDSLDIHYEMYSEIGTGNGTTEATWTPAN